MTGPESESDLSVRRGAGGWPLRTRQNDTGTSCSMTLFILTKMLFNWKWRVGIPDHQESWNGDIVKDDKYWAQHQLSRHSPSKVM